MTTSRVSIYAGYFYPPEIICYAVRLYFRYSPSLRMVEELFGCARYRGQPRDGPAMGVAVSVRSLPAASGSEHRQHCHHGMITPDAGSAPLPAPDRNKLTVPTLTVASHFCLLSQRRWRSVNLL